MKLKNKITGQILKLESGQIFGEIAENKNAATQPYNIAIAVDDVLIQSLLSSNLVDWEEFKDLWVYETKYRYLATNDEIAKVAITLPSDKFSILQSLRKVTFENCVELYFDYIEEWFSPYINLNKLELNNDLV